MFSNIDFGKGFDFWNTMPTSLRRAVTLYFGSYIDSPSIIISPSVLVPGMMSFILLMHRINVDFPHPDGPMRASTELAFTDRLTFLTAAALP
jgi:hypothetical protein